MRRRVVCSINAVRRRGGSVAIEWHLPLLVWVRTYEDPGLTSNDHSSSPSFWNEIDSTMSTLAYGEP